MNSLDQAPAAALASSQEGRAGEQTNVLSASGTLDQTRAFTELHLADGRVLRLDTRSLMGEGETQSDRTLAPPTHSADAVTLDDQVTIPLIEEHLVLDKRIVETAKVRLRKTVETYEEQLNEPLTVSTYDVDRIILNKVVSAVPEIRHEGDTTVYPLVEEHLILTRQLVLKEEVRVTRRVTERRDTQVVTLHREHMTVERESIAPEHIQGDERQSTRR